MGQKEQQKNNEMQGIGVGKREGKESAKAEGERVEKEDSMYVPFDMIGTGFMEAKIEREKEEEKEMERKNRGSMEGGEKKKKRGGQESYYEVLRKLGEGEIEQQVKEGEWDPGDEESESGDEESDDDDFSLSMDMSEDERSSQEVVREVENDIMKDCQEVNVTPPNLKGKNKRKKKKKGGSSSGKKKAKASRRGGQKRSK